MEGGLSIASINNNKGNTLDIVGPWASFEYLLSKIGGTSLHGYQYFFQEWEPHYGNILNPKKSDESFSLSPENASILDAYRQMKAEEKTQKQKAKAGENKSVLSAEDKHGKAHKRAYGKNQSQNPQDAEN